MKTLKVSEVFYSLQGEGQRVGEPSIFVRLQGCSAKFACAQSGVLCDTEFESGEEMDLPTLYDRMYRAVISAAPPTGITQYDAWPWIVWTGGEPLDQLTPEILRWFREQGQGHKQAIETSGVRKLDKDLASLIDHITVSPKVAEHILEKHFGHLNRGHFVGDDIRYVVQVDELRYVRHAGQPGIPQPSIIAKYYYLSPHSDGAEINVENLHHCVKLCLENPQWRLSVQQHKAWKLL